METQIYLPMVVHLLPALQIGLVSFNGTILSTASEGEKKQICGNILLCLYFYLSCYSWNNLRELVEAKRDEIESAHGLQNFHIECNETIVSAVLQYILSYVQHTSGTKSLYVQHLIL